MSFLVNDRWSSINEQLAVPYLTIIKHEEYKCYAINRIKRCSPAVVRFNLADSPNRFLDLTNGRRAPSEQVQVLRRPVSLARPERKQRCTLEGESVAVG